MPLTPRPDWEPLPDPPGLDLAQEHEFEALATEDMAGIEDAADQAGLDLAGVESSRLDAEAATLQLGLDWASGAEEIAAQKAAADADTLVTELGAAADQDANLDALTVEFGDPHELPADPGAPPPATVPPGGELPA